jgi:hypothetical protein
MLHLPSRPKGRAMEFNWWGAVPGAYAKELELSNSQRPGVLFMR